MPLKIVALDTAKLRAQDTLEVDLPAQRVNVNGALALTTSVGGPAVRHQAPGALGASYDLTWPLTDGNAGQVLTTDGSGVLDWQSISAITGKYGSFFDTTDQIAVANTPTAMKLNSTDLSNGVSVQNDGFGNPTRITVAAAGVYNLQFSAQLHHTGGGGPGNTVDIWVRVDGSDVPATDTKIAVQTNAPYVVAAWNFFLNLAAGQYVQLIWATDNASIRLEYEPQSFAPPNTFAHPAVPSLIVTMTQL